VQNILLNQFLLRQNIYREKDELDALRFRLLRKQLFLAYRNVQFYKTIFDQAGVNPSNLKSIQDLSSYPVITKDIIRSNNLINHNTLIKYKFKSHTSGSTGQPMWTNYDFKSWIRKKYLVKARARMECGVKLNDKIAVFESTSQNYKENTNILFQKLKSRYRVFSIFEPLQNSVQNIINFSPVVLYGSPSYFFQLGKYIPVPNICRKLYVTT
jgi:phenylacetate-CoA ligase